MKAHLPSAAVPKNRSRRTAALWFLAISALYFADTLGRAALKPFWLDELFTLYLCRLPSFTATWNAVVHGCDFNLPIFYLATRASEHLFGEGLIATRLPEILGFWVFGICLYLFVSRRLGALRGAIAALIPVFTLAHVYAYEARAHGVVLAWLGLLLVCWQRVREEDTSPRARWQWLAALAISLLGALLTHVYAVYFILPFLLVELIALLRHQRVFWGIVAVLLLAPPVVTPLYLRMMRTYTSINSVAGIQTHVYEVMKHSLTALYGPSLLLLLIALALGAWELQARSTDREQPDSERSSLSMDELLLAFGLILLPFFGAATVRFNHGPFFDRYFLAAVAGVALLIAQITARRAARSLVARGMLASLLVLFVADIGLVTRALLGHGAIAQLEPSSQFAFSTSPSQPLSRDQALLDDKSGRDILVLEDINFLTLYHYASPKLRHRLYFGAQKTSDPTFTFYRRLADWTHLADLRTTTFQDFLATHDDFLVYSTSNGVLNGDCFDCLNQFLDAGYTLRSVKRDPESMLEHFSK